MHTAWQTLPLSEACSFKPSKSVPRKNLAEDTEVSFVPMNDLGELEKHFEPKETRRFGDVVKSYTYFADGDVLCAKITPCFENGKLGVANNLKNGVGFGSSEFVVMRPKHGLLPEFLYYYLSRDEFRITGAGTMSGAVGHKRVPKEYFEDLLIPLPPLDEQKRIVAMLDQAFAALDRARENAEANVADAGELFPSLLAQIFSPDKSWRLHSIADLVRQSILERPIDGNHGETHPKKADFVETGVPFIMASDLGDGSVDQSECYFISRKQADGLRKGFAKDGDVLLSHKGTIGRVAILRTDLDYVMLTPQVTYYRVIDETRLDRQFLYYCLQSSAFQSQMSEIAGSGATRAYIGITRQLDLQIPLPDLEIQKQLVSTFQGAEKAAKKLLGQYEVELTNISHLRQSILQKAFSGQLT